MKNSDWKEHTITEVCTLIADCVNRTAPVVDYETEYKMIRTSNIKNGKIDYSDVKYVTSETFEYWNRRAIPRKDDVILTREAPYGEVGINNGKDKIFLGQRLMLYRTDEKKCNAHFLYYSFLSDFCQNQFHKYASGSTVQHIKVPDAKRILIKLPPLPTQQKIADILGAYDELIENNRRRIVLLENMAAGLYKEWFVRMRPHGQILPKNAETGLPEGWEIVKIAELYNTSSGGTPSREKEEYFGGEINWIKTGELNDGFLFETEEKVTELGLKNSSAKLFPPLTVIIAMYGATIGQLGITTIESCANQACCALLPKVDGFGAYYIFMTLLIQRGELINFGNGAAQQNISQDEIKKFKILKPDSKTIEKFNDIITPLFNQIKTLQEQTGVLHRVRDRLLPRLMSGELGG